MSPKSRINVEKVIMLMLFLFVFYGCGGSGDNQSVIIKSIDVSVKALKDGQPVTKVSPGDQITLSAEGTTDPNKNLSPLAYQWTQKTGATVSLGSANTVNTNAFTVPNAAQALTFELSVTNSKVTSKKLVVLPLDNPITVDLPEKTILPDNSMEKVINFNLTLPDDVTAPSLVSVSSSDENVIAAPDVLVSINGTSGSITIAQCTGSGTTNISFTIDNGYGETTEIVHTIEVIAAASLPTINGISNVAFDEDGNTTMNFTVGDLETPAGSLILSAVSSDQSLIPDGNLIFGGSDANRSLTISSLSDMHGTAQITITVQDADLLTADAAFTVTVNSKNDPPSASFGGNQTVLEDASAQSVPWASNISPGPQNEEGQSVVFNVTSSNLELFDVAPAISATGVLSYTPAADKNGVSTVTVTLEDSEGGLSEPYSFTITITPKEDEPIVTLSNISLEADGTTKTFSGSLVDYGFDADGDSLSYAVVEGQSGTKGTVVINEDGSFTYTSNSALVETDSFQFKVYDGKAWSSPSTVTITTTYSAPIAEDQTVTLNVMDRSITITLSATSAKPLTFQEYTSPGKGFISGAWPNITYELFDGSYALGQDTFQFKVDDGISSSNVATVTINLEGGDSSGDVNVGTNPVANLDMYLFEETETSYREYKIELAAGNGNTYITNFSFEAITSLIPNADYGVRMVPRNELGSVLSSLSPLSIGLTGSDGSTVSLTESDLQYSSDDGGYFLSTRKIRVSGGALSLL